MPLERPSSRQALLLKANRKRPVGRIARSQIQRWFGQLNRMPQERHSKQALLTKANWKGPV